MIKALIIDLHGILVTGFPLAEYMIAVKAFLNKKGFDAEGSLQHLNLLKKLDSLTHQ